MTSAPLDSIICYSCSQNSGKDLIRFTSLLKDMIKDTEEPPDAEMHRARSGRVPSAGASVPMRLGCDTFLRMCSPT